MRLPRKRWIFLTLAIAAAAILYLAYQDLNRVETGENVSHVSWLPASASNVSYYRSYNFLAFEFDISETEFLNWANGNDVKPVRESFSIPRYTRAIAPPTVLPESATEDDFQRFLAEKTKESATITDGYFYEQERGRSGGFTRVAWDRTTGRAYFQSNPR